MNIVAMIEKYAITYIQTHPEVLERIVKALLDRVVAEMEERLAAPK